ncbi:hypothetical protein D9757_012585 [Collybiopsis confluens]|uniref:Tyrosinase copper-binding domain-containing protein n=1 Tax=Collybiopsis confluens TaxID=2823264 RepID=A0A8H5FVJ2_9AGAR|nr:hypothetical protein D9757_012585 [Collybiopsis confluens]
MSSQAVITGRSNTGGTYPRLSIHDLEQEKDQFILFTFSYLIIQDRAQNFDETSLDFLEALQNAFNTVYASIKSPALMFTAIAGIHGLPYEKWPGDPLQGDEADYNANNKRDMRAFPSRFGGYCNHGSVLFPTWHRPYMMAIEPKLLNWIIEDSLAAVPDVPQKFAFDGPYSIKVHYTDKKNNPRYVGSISVFSRQPESNCANCKKKRSFGTLIHGLIIVPPEIIQDVREIVEEPGSEESIFALHPTFAEELKKRLHAKIINRWNNEIASAKGGSPSDEEPGSDAKPLDQNQAPKITLISSNVGQNRARKGPLIWYNWTSHGDLFGNGDTLGQGEIFKPYTGVHRWRVRN